MTTRDNNKHLHYNPDVLEALANLSSDEVFTPPEVESGKKNFICLSENMFGNTITGI